VPHLRPFRALRYDAHAIADLGRVLCPPYDVISPERRANLAARHPRNAVHLELPVAGNGGDAYAEAGRLFGAWQADGTLRRDDKPMIYVYEQEYRIDGRPARSRGFFCLLGLEPWGNGIRRHELTLSGPKEDRLRLLHAVGANLSPVLLLYSSRDVGGPTGPLLDRLTDHRPAVRAGDDEGVEHRLWPAAGNSADVAGLLRLVSGAPLTVADGHHRYETALHYRAEQAAQPTADHERPSNHVLVLLYEAESGGLAVLPTHRVLRQLRAADRFVEQFAELFVMDRVEGLASALEAITVGGRMALRTPADTFVLTPLPAFVDEVLPDASAELRGLEVSVLNAALPRLTGADASRLVESGQLSYTKSAEEAVGLVETGKAGACVLLPPPRIEAVLAVAANGEQMPEKSTYFYPKAATGLVFNTLRS